MNVTLRTKVTAFVAVTVITISMISTFLFISAQKRGIERELIARGFALSESLSRAIDEGLAAEDLNLIKDVEEIVHTKDVVLVQAFSTLWLEVASAPVDQLNLPPDPAAVEHFKTTKMEYGHFYIDEGGLFDIYTPVMLDTHDLRVPKLLIGYVRLKISTEQIRRSIKDAIIFNATFSALITLFAVFVLNAIITKYIHTPILTLNNAVSKYKRGEFLEIVPIHSNDEIGELSSEFNQMSRTIREREERLAEEKERLFVTLRSIGDAVIVTDISGTITLFNKIAEQNTGWPAEEAIGRPFSEIFYIINEKTRERCEDLVAKVKATGAIAGLANNTVLIRKDRSEIIIEDTAAPIKDKNGVIIGIVLVFRDVTEQRRAGEEKTKLESQLIQSQKMEAVGLLAGGIAHDFNNILTAIIGYGHLLNMKLGKDSALTLFVDQILSASERAANLTRQILAFSRKQILAPKETELNSLISGMQKLLRRLIGEDIEFRTYFTDKAITVMVDQGQIEQVLMNLCTNARDAMPNGGLLSIGTDIVEMDEHYVKIQGFEKPGSYALVFVTDTGVGMDEKTKERIFDPFFTTKEMGRGTGLGLAIVYGIIKQHNGNITVYSELGKGTTFRIYLPLIKTTTEEIKVAEVVTMPRGTETILLAEDNNDARKFIAVLLVEFGYKIIEAVDGEDAVNRFRAHKDDIQLVILDVVMPSKSGKAARDEIMKIQPDIKVLFTSGYTADIISSKGIQEEGIHFISKPVTPYDLLVKVREILDQKESL